METFDSVYDSKLMEKLELEIQYKKIKNYIAQLKATKLERKLKLAKSEFTVENGPNDSIEFAHLWNNDDDDDKYFSASPQNGGVLGSEKDATS